MFKRILLAYNGSRDGKSALIEGAELSSLTNAENHLLAVAGMPSTMFLTEGFMPEEVLEEEKKRAQETLDEGVAQYHERGIAVTGHLAVGEPVEEICRLAKEIDADLIVIGHEQNASFAKRWWGGSVGKSIIDQTPVFKTSFQRGIRQFCFKGKGFDAFHYVRFQTGFFQIHSFIPQQNAQVPDLRISQKLIKIKTPEMQFDSG